MLTVETQHEGTEGLAINSTIIRRFLALLALKTTAKFYARDGFCTPISRHKIVKTGRWIHLTEAATMKFVADHSSLPVPKVYCSFVHGNRAYIVMKRIQGVGLATALGKMPEESRLKIFAQLRDMLQELRALQPPSNTGVESFAGGSLYDSRIPRCLPRFGPFKTIQDFHLWLRDGLQPSEESEWGEHQDWQDIKAMAAMQDRPWPPPGFTHGDLNPSNVLVRGDKVVGIIDWEFSGWYPPYWEFTSAWNCKLTGTEWQGLLDKFLDPYPAELKMETTRQIWWGE
ncbi:hypothetical protein FQN49_005564 [Arthroderma sp. PD_2]|nr:hypothetical protein FQN49_005564 [Arthroderma sp. PD_2]